MVDAMGSFHIMNNILEFGPTAILVVIDIAFIAWIFSNIVKFSQVATAIHLYKKFAKTVDFSTPYMTKMGMSAKQAARALDDFGKAFNDFEQNSSSSSPSYGPQILKK